MTRTRNKKAAGAEGFTLIEILVVLILIGLLASLVAPKVINNLGPSKLKAAKAQISALETAVQEFYLKKGRYPTQEEGLEALKPLLGKDIPTDPWGNPYVYTFPGTHGDFDIVAYGGDGREGGEGNDQDVASWKSLALEE